MITVFTPTYNRAKTLPRLYESLISQTDKRFEWLIIDDGSTDSTEDLVRSYMKDSPFEIRYVKRENWGLSQTLNQGAELAKGDIFFRIDSDDYATPDAIETIYSNWYIVEKDESLCGLVFLKKSFSDDGGIPCPFTENIRCNFFDYRNLYISNMDMAEVIRTDVMRMYKLPKFNGEKFCPEGVMWNRMSLKYDAIYIPYPIYMYKYIEDGFTMNVRRTLKKNPMGASTFFAEVFHHSDMRILFYVKNAISYWRYALINGRSWKEKLCAVPVWVIVLGLFAGSLLCMYDSVKIKDV